MVQAAFCCYAKTRRLLTKHVDCSTEKDTLDFRMFIGVFFCMLLTGGLRLLEGFGSIQHLNTVIVFL